MNDLVNVWTNRLDVLRMRGLRRCLIDFSVWSVRKRFLVFAGDMSDGLQKRSRIPLAIEPLNVDDVGRLRALRRYDEQLSKRRLGQGHLCYLLTSRGAPVGVRWIFRGRFDVPFLDRSLVVGDGDVYLGEAYTAPAFRRQRIQPYSGYLIRQDLRQRGYARMLVLIAAWNEHALAGVRTVGWPEIGELRRWNLPGWPRYGCRGAVRELPGGDIALG